MSELLRASVHNERTGKNDNGPFSVFRAADALTTDRAIRATALQHLVVNPVIIAFNIGIRDSGFASPGPEPQALAEPLR